jgi:hypothetical protein
LQAYEVPGNPGVKKKSLQKKSLQKKSLQKKSQG